MVSFTYLIVALTAITGSIAAPTESAPLYTRDLEQIAPDLELHNVSSLMRRQDFNQNYKTGGNVNFNPTSNGYSLTFSGAADFVVGKGWNTGSAR
jgi:endo-1,4-beta-xylanase